MGKTIKLLKAILKLEDGFFFRRNNSPSKSPQGGDFKRDWLLNTLVKLKLIRNILYDCLLLPSFGGVGGGF